MTTYSWAKNVDGDWNTGTLWTPSGPPTATDDAVIDAVTNQAYTVTIAAGETAHANSLTMNGTNNLDGSNNPNGYLAAELELDGTLEFGAGSAGLLGGSLQTFVHVAGGNNAAIVNGGTLDGFIQVEGNLLITGTNGVYITNWLQALAGSVTIDTKSIAEMDGTTLFDGIFEAKGPGSAIYLGGPKQGLHVDITKVEGPQDIPTGWTELIFNDSTAVIDEWNGSAYVPLESTLTEIDAGGTVDVLQGRNYTTTTSLTITHLGASSTAGLLNLEAGTVKTAGITIDGGIVQGHATLNSNVVNNGTLIALGGTLSVTGSLTGTGLVEFDTDKGSGTVHATGAEFAVHSVSAGQKIVMGGSDTLQINSLADFAGTIDARVGDHIVLNGVSATSAQLGSGKLVILNGTQTVGSLALTGDYTGEKVTVSGSTLGFASAGGTGTTTITATTPGQVVSITSGNNLVFLTAPAVVSQTGGSSTIYASASGATVNGGSGDMTFADFGGGATVVAGNGNLNYFGVKGTSTVLGGSGTETLWGSGGNDLFQGGTGSKLAALWGGSDTFVGGGSNQTIWGVASGTNVSLNGTGANIWAVAWAGSETINAAMAGGHDNLVYANWTTDSSLFVGSSAGNDVFWLGMNAGYDLTSGTFAARTLNIANWQSTDQVVLDTGSAWSYTAQDQQDVNNAISSGATSVTLSDNTTINFAFAKNA